MASVNAPKMNSKTKTKSKLEQPKTCGGGSAATCRLLGLCCASRWVVVPLSGPRKADQRRKGKADLWGKSNRSNNQSYRSKPEVALEVGPAGGGCACQKQ